MKKLLCFLIMLLVCSTANAAYEQSKDKTVAPYLLCGLYDGVPTPVAVGADGTLDLDVITGFTDYAMVYSVSEDLTYNNNIVATAEGGLTVNELTVSGSGESVLTLEDDAATSYDLTFKGTSWYVDGVEIESGVDLSGITDGSLLYDNADTLAGFGEYDGTDLTIDGAIIIDSNENAINFSDCTTTGQIQVNEELVIDLTETGVTVKVEATFEDDLLIDGNLTLDAPVTVTGAGYYLTWDAVSKQVGIKKI